MLYVLDRLKRIRFWVMDLRFRYYEDFQVFYALVYI